MSSATDGVVVVNKLTAFRCSLITSAGFAVLGCTDEGAGGSGGFHHKVEQRSSSGVAPRVAISAELCADW